MGNYNSTTNNQNGSKEGKDANNNNKNAKDQNTVSKAAYYKLPIASNESNNKKKDTSKSPHKEELEKSTTLAPQSQTESLNSEVDRSEASMQDIGNDSGSIRGNDSYSEHETPTATSRKMIVENEIQTAFKKPHNTFVIATPVTNVVKEKISNDEFMYESLASDIIMKDELEIYDIPLHSVGIRMLKNRRARSRVDPWRKHGALVKLCEIGGSMPELKGRNNKKKSFVQIKKGSMPPPAPKSKPLTSVEDYMTFKDRDPD